MIDLGLQLDRQGACAAHRFEAEEELPRQWEDEVVDQRAASEEQDRRGDQKRREGAFFVLVKARRDEHPHLDGDEWEGQEQGGEKGDLDIGEEGLVKGGEDQPALAPHFLQHIGQGRDQEVVKLRGEVITDEKQHHDGDEGMQKARAKLNQMI